MRYRFCIRATCRNTKCEKNQIHMQKITSDKKNKGIIIDIINYPKDNNCPGFK